MVTLNMVPHAHEWWRWRRRFQCIFKISFLIAISHSSARAEVMARSLDLNPRLQPGAKQTAEDNVHFRLISTGKVFYEKTSFRSAILKNDIVDY